MQALRKSRDRGHTKLDWLESRHSFSFGNYRDAAHESFGALRVINEDVIAGSAGFEPHPHRDMEIVTYVLSGTLSHRDSLGNGSTIRPGQIQRMTAGRGIVHAEFNASRERPVHLLQIWIEPSKPGLDPSYEQKDIDLPRVVNKLARIASCDPLANEVRLVQDAEIWLGRFDRDEEAIHRLAQGRKAWVQVAQGKIEIGTHKLEAGDGLAVSDEDSIALRARGPAEILLFDLV